MMVMTTASGVEDDVTMMNTPRQREKKVGGGGERHICRAKGAAETRQKWHVCDAGITEGRPAREGV